MSTLTHPLCQYFERDARQSIKNQLYTHIPKQYIDKVEVHESADKFHHYDLLVWFNEESTKYLINSVGDEPILTKH